MKSIAVCTFSLVCAVGTVAGQPAAGSSTSLPGIGASMPVGPRGPSADTPPGAQANLVAPFVLASSAGSVSLNPQPLPPGTRTPVVTGSPGSENPIRCDQTKIGSATGGAGAGKLKFGEMEVHKHCDSAATNYYGGKQGVGPTQPVPSSQSQGGNSSGSNPPTSASCKQCK
jgi:hypothetical protein